MTRWEYARLTGGDGVSLKFSHREYIRLPKGTTFDSILRNLGDDGWEMVSHSTDRPYGSTTWFKQPMVR